MIKSGMQPIRPRQVLLEEFLKPSAPESMPTGSPGPSTYLPIVTSIIKGHRRFTGDSAVRLSAFLNSTAEFWMSLQKL